MADDLWDQGYQAGFAESQYKIEAACEKLKKIRRGLVGVGTSLGTRGAVGQFQRLMFYIEHRVEEVLKELED